MKNNKWNLITALSDLTASICFVFAATSQAEMPSKVLNIIAASGFLTGSIGFFCTYIRKRTADDK